MSGGLQTCPKCGVEFMVNIDQGAAWGQCRCGYGYNTVPPQSAEETRPEDRGRMEWQEVRVVIIAVEPYQTGKGCREFPIAGGASGAEAQANLREYRPPRAYIAVDGIGEDGRHTLYKTAVIDPSDKLRFRKALQVADRWADRARREAE